MRHLIAMTVLGSALSTGLSAAAEDAHASGHKPWSQADKIWGEAAMAKSRHHVLKHHGDGKHFFIGSDRLEVRSNDEEDVLLWDGDAWYGGDINKLWIKSEGEYSFDHSELEEAEVQVLWSRAISPYFDFQTGIRYDFEPEGRAHGVIGFQGMAPYRFEIDTAAFLSDQGDMTASLEVEYEFALSQRLHLHPRVEFGWSAQESNDLGLGEGFTNGEAGLRLSYDIIREFAPYIGVEWSGAFGETEDLLSAAGEKTDKTVFLIGVKTWF